MYSGGYSQGFKSASADNLSQLDDGDVGKHNKVKRLSWETNRRRRELAVRLKKEAEKEEQRKQEILEQRREKQRHATERFQRCFSARSRRSPIGIRSRSPSRGAELDAMLQLIRGAPGSLPRQNSWDSVRHHAWPAAADAADPWRHAEPEQSNNSAAKFQLQLDERQQRLAAEQRHHLAAFSKVVESYVEPETAPVDSLEVWEGQEEAVEAPQPPPQPLQPPPQPSAIPVPKVRVQPPAHFRFVVEEEEERRKEKEKREEEEVESVTSAASSGVKSILKRKSVYSPPGQRATGQAVRDSLEVTRGHRLLGRSHSEEHLPTEEPEDSGRRRKSVRFAARLTEDLTSPRRQTAGPPSPKPRRLFSTAPAAPAPGPAPAARPVAGKPPQHPGASPGRGNAARPERITSATLAKVASQNAALLRQRAGSVEDVSATDADPPDVQQSAQHQPPTEQPLPQAEQPPPQQQHMQPNWADDGDTSKEIHELTERLQQQQEQHPEQQRQQRQLLSKGIVTVPTGSQPRFSNSEPLSNGLGGPSVPDPSAQPHPGPIDLENFPMDKTPTESDIEWLWAKVRSCLHRPEGGSVGGDSNSDFSIQSAPARAVAPMSSHLIDGAAISLGSARGRARGSRAAEVRAVHHSVSPHARRLALLRQREMNQHLQRSTDATDSQAVSESMVDFLENEALCQQSFNSTAPAANGRLSAASEMAEVAAPARPPSGSTARRRVMSRDQHRPPSLQPYGSYLTPHPPPARRGPAGPRPHLANGYRPLSSLSIEEQRLMKSLERINDKLKATGLSK